MNPEKQHAQALLNHLAPEQISAIVHLMEVMLDPLSRKLANAPAEDEEIGEAESLAVAEAKEWRKHNAPVPHEDVLADLGLTPEDFREMGRHPLAPVPGNRN